MERKNLSWLALLLLSSCTVGPDYRQPQFFDNADLSKVFATNPGHSEMADIQWFRQFGDETLNRLVYTALLSSPNVKIALQRLKEARYSLLINEAEFLPTFNVDGGYTYNYLSNGNKMPRVVEDYYKVGLDASWEIDIWGGGRRLNESSRALLRAAADNLANVLLTMTAEVANDYIMLRTMQYQLQVTQRNLELQEEIYQTVEAKYKSGLADDSALNQAQYAVETTKSLLPQLEQQEEAYKNAIAILLGVLPGEVAGLEPAEDNLVSRRFYFDFNKLYDFPVEVVRNRPDVRAAENNLIAKNAEIGQAVAALFPQVSLSGMVGWQAANLSGIGSSSYAAYGYSPAVSLPLFNFGQLRNRVKMAEATKEEYVFVYQNALLTAVQDIKNSSVAVQKEYQRNLSLQKSADNMRNVVELMTEQYKQGLIEFSDLLASEQNMLSAENSLAASNGTVYQNIIGFYKAIGGGY